jgi:nucleotide-binding universal stress UspA family protein
MGSDRKERQVSERIVVGVDGSDGARVAVRWAAAEAARRNGRLELVSAWHFPASSGTFAIAYAVDELVKDLTRAAERQLGEAAADARAIAPDVIVETHVAEAQPATALLEAAAGADLLVIGSRGLGGFRGLLLGSVSQQCAHHATCPVVIVPTPRAA